MTKVTNIYNKTIVTPPVNSATLGFGIAPVNPSCTDSPMSIPFVLTNRGADNLYSVKCMTAIHSILLQDKAAGHVDIEDSTFTYLPVLKDVFGPNDHIAFGIGLGALDSILSSLGPAVPGTAADIEFILTFQNKPAGPRVANSYRFTLVLGADKAWDWLKTN